MDYWQKQTSDDPLFPELLWSRPENRRHAGKLAIIGGNGFGFASVGEAFTVATNAGAGTIRVLLPTAVQKIVGSLLPAGEFAPSNPSGSFSQNAIAEFLDIAAWADCVLLAGDLGRNSETAILLENFIQKCKTSLVIAKDAVDYFTGQPDMIIGRPDTTVVLSLAQLQKLCSKAKFQTAITYSMDTLRLVDALHGFTLTHKLEVIVMHHDTVFVAVKGQVSSTRLQVETDSWRVSTAAKSAVWRLQNPSKPFQSLSTSLIQKIN